MNKLMFNDASHSEFEYVKCTETTEANAGVTRNVLNVEFADGVDYQTVFALANDKTATQVLRFTNYADPEHPISNDFKDYTVTIQCSLKNTDDGKTHVFLQMGALTETEKELTTVSIELKTRLDELEERVEALEGEQA